MILSRAAAFLSTQVFLRGVPLGAFQPAGASVIRGLGELIKILGVRGPSLRVDIFKPFLALRVVSPLLRGVYPVVTEQTSRTLGLGVKADYGYRWSSMAWYGLLTLCAGCRFDTLGLPSLNQDAGNLRDSDLDLDIDNDGVSNDVDNCREVPNPLQDDNEGDGVGDPCDLDDDNDGWDDKEDNCPLIFNADQTNRDSDTPGDACDYEPYLLRPADGLFLAPTRAFLAWEVGAIPPGKSIVHYEVCSTTDGVGAISEPTACPNSVFVDNPYEPLDPLLAGADYLWKVRVCYDEAIPDCSNFSALGLFFTDNSLLAWWRFDEGSGTTASDSSSNGYTGTLAGTNGPPLWTAGPLGGALQFDGVDDYLFIGDIPALEGMSGLTVTVLVNTTSAGTNRAIVAKWYGSPSSYALRLDTGTVGAIQFSTQTGPAYPDDTTNSSSTSVVNDGNWHDIVGTYDGINQSIAIDGLAEDTDPQSGSISDSEEELCIGDFCNAGVGQGSPFEGLIDEVILYLRAFASEEVLNHYCAIRALGGLPLPTVCLE